MAPVPNALLALFVIAFVPVAWVSGWSLHEIALRGSVFAVALVAIMALFARGILNGGAGKLILVTLLWLPPLAGVTFGVACAFLIKMLGTAARLGTPPWLRLVGDKFAAIVALLGIAFLAASA